MIALFLILLAAAYLLYFSGKQMAAFLIFFFFLLKALQLIPEAWMGLKGLDFALLFVLPLFVWGCIREEEFIPRGRLTFFIFLFLAFILGECLLSRFYYGIDWISIFRTGRQSLLLLAYFLFRRLSKEEVTLISKILLAVLSVQCVLFMLQTITGIGLLAEHENNYSNGLFYRFYNVPILLYILVYYAVFANPFHGIWRVITTALPVLTIFAPMHRSLMAIFIMLLLIGILWIRGYLQSVRNILVASVTVFVLVVGALYYMSSRAVSDIERVTSGEFVDVEEVDLSDEST
ncbi:MAG: hypothetical protein LBM06_06645, partial [Prevotellaceae bacterium]|nr:hypothetical protein [Prevotellaceae bacterium]